MTPKKPQNMVLRVNFRRLAAGTPINRFVQFLDRLSVLRRAQLILFWRHKSPASWKLKYPDWPAIACPTIT